MEISRRAVLRRLGIGAGVCGSLIAPASRPRFGRLTVDGHRAHQRATGELLRVYLDGHDVTDRCCEADDTIGVVRLYCYDRVAHRWDVARGALHEAVGGGGCCIHRLSGDVLIVAGRI